MKEIKRVESGPFNFVLYSNGEVAVSSRSLFINAKERPRLLKEAKELFKIELLYLAKAKEFNFKPGDLATEEGRQEAMRYLLVNGLVPLIAENVAMVGNETTFFIGAEKIPKEMQDKIMEQAMNVIDEWEHREDQELEEHKVLSTTLHGIWIKNGKIIQAKIDQDRKIRVSTEYDTPEFEILI